jgi:hypothetical protein
MGSSTARTTLPMAKAAHPRPANRSCSSKISVRFARPPTLLRETSTPYLEPNTPGINLATAIRLVRDWLSVVVQVNRKATSRKSLFAPLLLDASSASSRPTVRAAALSHSTPLRTCCSLVAHRKLDEREHTNGDAEPIASEPDALHDEEFEKSDHDLRDNQCPPNGAVGHPSLAFFVRLCRWRSNRDEGYNWIGEGDKLAELGAATGRLESERGWRDSER